VKVVKTAWMLMVAMAALSLGTPAYAEDSVTAKVPFAFVVNGVSLPAGSYVITRDARHPDLLSIAHADGRQITLTLTRGSSADPDTELTPKLEFTRVGNEYQLTRIVLAAHEGREIVAAR
jgi:hypothetical protein